MRAARLFRNATVILALVISGRCLAETENRHPDVNQSKFETQTLLGGGGPVGLIGANLYEPGTTLPLSVRLAQRFRFPLNSPLGLELNFVVPIGLGVNVLCDVYRSDRVRVHLGDPGVHWNMVQPVSVGRVGRTWDLTLGGGLDVRLTDRLWLTLDWRAYLPDPTSVIGRYGDWARPIYKEAALGGQLWLGIARVW